MSNQPLTVERVVAAYQKLAEQDIIPRACVWARTFPNGKKCACGLSAIYLAESGDVFEVYENSHTDFTGFLQDKLGLTYDDVGHFIDGFDNAEYVIPRHAEGRDYPPLTIIGAQAYKAVTKE